jgi:peptidyl-prolyl cis-trans isomerase C
MMTASSMRLAAFALAACVALPAIAQDSAPGADTVVATVNGAEITVGHLLSARRDLPEQYQSLPDEILFTGLLDQLVQQEVLAQSVEALPRAALIALENERRTLGAGTAIEATLAEGVSEEDIAAAYAAQYGDVPPGVEYNASHILVETEEEAAAIVAELGEGADFATLAQERSTGPSGPNGGSLGWFSTGMMVPSFEEAVITLEPGEVSAPVQTQFGWHVITLNETREAPVPSLEDVRATLRAELQQAAVEARIAELTDAADISRSVDGLDPSLISQMDLLAD